MLDQAELARIRYVTTHFELLQGLAVLPVLGWIAFATLWTSDWASGWLVVAAALPAAGASYAALVHYRRTYGQVRGGPGRKPDYVLVWQTTGVVGAAALAGEFAPNLPVSLPVLILAVGALAGAWFHRPLAAALVPVGCAGLVVSLVPFGGVTGVHPLSATEHWILAYCAGFAVLQLWGHVLLRRALGARKAAASE